MAAAPRWPTRIQPYHIAVVVVIISAVFLGYTLAILPPGTGPVRVVGDGDIVSVDYIGLFEDGLVFDTSRREVALDNASYPKAVSFEYRAAFRPLEFTVAGEVSTVIRGFEEGVVGMRIGETRLLEVPEELGYGPSNPALIEDRPLVEELAQFETLTRTEFSLRFGVGPDLGVVAQEPFWGWNVTVTATSASLVTIMHLPTQDSLVAPHGAWSARVDRVDSAANGGEGLIVVRHLLDARDVDSVQADDDRGTFRVVAVQSGAGTYTVDYNREVVGRTLFFEVELISIRR